MKNTNVSSEEKEYKGPLGILVGGQISPDETGNIEMPPQSAKEGVSPYNVLNEGNFEIQVEGFDIVKGEDGKIHRISQNKGVRENLKDMSKEKYDKIIANQLAKEANNAKKAVKNAKATAGKSQRQEEDIDK